MGSETGYEPVYGTRVSSGSVAITIGTRVAMKAMPLVGVFTEEEGIFHLPKL